MQAVLFLACAKFTKNNLILAHFRFYFWHIWHQSKKSALIVLQTSLSVTTYILQYIETVHTAFKKSIKSSSNLDTE